MNIGRVTMEGRENTDKGAKDEIDVELTWTLQLVFSLRAVHHDGGLGCCGSK
jgi:hypothetical protein